MTRPTTAFQRRRASSTVELAMVAPILLAVVFAIIEFGWYFMVRTMVHHAASETARLAVLPGYGCEDDCDTGALYENAEALLEGSLDLSGGAFHFHRDQATSSDDPCEVITVTLDTAGNNVLLPGYILALIGIPSNDQIEFTVRMAHPDHVTATGNGGSPCPSAS